MKRLLTLLLCFTFCLAFAACGQAEFESAKTIYVGKIYLDLPGGWNEKMQSDQTTFIFKNDKGNEMGRLTVSTKAVKEPQAVTDFKEVKPTVQGENFKHPIYIISGTAQDGLTVTEYHFIYEKRDYAFIFADGVKEKTIREVLDSIKTVKTYITNY